MRLFAKRWRLRTLMAAVAAVGVGLGGWLTIERRRAEFRRRVDLHTEAKRPYRRFGAVMGCRNDTCAEYQAAGYPPSGVDWHWHPFGGLLTKAERTWSAYHAALAEKYDQAASRPWLPVVDDPPAPPDPTPMWTGPFPTQLLTVPGG